MLKFIKNYDLFIVDDLLLNAYLLIFLDKDFY
jgi:hypothetical protein